MNYWPIAIMVLGILATFVFLCKYAVENAENVRVHERYTQAVEKKNQRRGGDG